MPRKGRPPSQITRVVNALLGELTQAARSKRAKQLVREADELKERAKDLLRTAKLLGGSTRRRRRRRRRTTTRTQA